MTKRLSEQLTELVTRAKSAEDTLDATKSKAHDKVIRLREEAHATAIKAVERINQEANSVSGKAATNWEAIKAKISLDMDHLKSKIAVVKQERDMKRAQERADWLEWEAGFAIDYAIASVEQAKLAVLDAIDGRLAAEEVKQG
ncbi:MAG: hypothetical protein U1E61_09000 [Bradyrhizobium sp.]